MSSNLAPLRLALLLAAALAACDTATVAPKSPSAQSVAVTVTPPSTALPPGGSATFTARVTGTANTAVAWSVAEGTAGGVVSATGFYTAPAAAGTFHVVATSQADPTASGAATVTVTAPVPVTVAISPPSASLDACATTTFTATVTGSANTKVDWSVTEGASGGSVTTSGVYTAPAVAGTFHVVATSQADPTASQTAPVTVAADRVLGVSVSPSRISVAPGGSAQFTATVTTSCGSFQQAAIVTGDGKVSPL